MLGGDCEDTVDGLLSSIDYASQKMLTLTEMKKGVRKLNIEMSVSAAKSREELCIHFADLKKQINDAIENRLTALLAEVTTVEAESVTQFNLYEDEIKQCLDDTKLLMEEGKSFLKNDPDKLTDEINAFRKTADKKLKQKLPEPPPGDPATSVVVELPRILPSILRQIIQHGDVISRIPVRITTLDQRPGGLLVTWQEICPTEEDSGGEMVEYRLQMSIKDDKQFSDVYQGSHAQFQVRGLKVGFKYHFRVTGRCEGTMKWSPYSEIQAATVVDRHHEWSTDTPDYAVTDENTVATRMSAEAGPSLIYSNLPSYTCGHQMSLRVLEVGPEIASTYIGLSIDKGGELKRQGTICINMAGKVYVNGCEMVTRLPALVQGSCLNISSEVLSPAKVRITLEVDERVVTSDWKLSDDQFSLPGLAEVAAQQTLYFALKCDENGWSFRVE